MCRVRESVQTEIFPPQARLYAQLSIRPSVVEQQLQQKQLIRIQLHTVTAASPALPSIPTSWRLPEENNVMTPASEAGL